jgi:hypothetical protein
MPRRFAVSEVWSNPKASPDGNAGDPGVSNKDAPSGRRDVQGVGGRPKPFTHGGSRDALREKIGMNLADAVNLAGDTAWHAVWQALPKLEGQPYIGSTGHGFADRDLTLTADILFEYPGDAAHPTDDQIPKPVISLQTRFGPRPDNQGNLTGLQG